MAVSLTYTQNSFDGGIDLVSNGTKVADNKYIIGLNVRTRYGTVEPVNDVIDFTEDLPVGYKIIQGLYAYGELLVCFVGGLAYYKNAGVDDVWHNVVGFILDSSVSRIYACAVPAATLVYLRKNNSGRAPNAGVILDPANTSGTSNVVLVCQDGINQPWLIEKDGTARISQDYTQWDINAREYIPIGKQMMLFNNSLYVVAPDSNKIYRSVSGRPLDFVIAVDNNGNKIADATPLSFAVDSNEVKLIAALSSDSLIVITAYTAYVVTPDFTNLIYGEPTFTQTFLFTAGTINQFCWVDSLGDFTFIDREGLKSFNAIKQLKFEGNNSVFSNSVSKLFRGLVQDDNVCVGTFDNYVFFAIKTIYSPSSILVYDTIKKTFGSVDLFSTKAIKQFAVTYSASRQRFFACSVDKVYELYSPNSTTPLAATLFTRELNSINSDQGSTDGVYNIKTEAVRLIFEDGVEDGVMTLSELVNNAKESTNYEKSIPASIGGIEYPVTYPVMWNLVNSVVPIDINKFKKREGQKIGFAITWTGGAKLIDFIARCACDKSPSSIQQQSLVYK